MTFVYNLIFFLLAITILVAVHEWGHFIVARLVGVKVLRFSIGFGKPIFSFIGKKGTQYVLAMVPLGGYVKMLDEEEASVAKEDLEGAFNRKPVWARIAVVVAGPALNFIFAVFAFWLMFIIGIKSLAPIIGSVKPNSIAAKSSLQPKDEIIKIKQQPIRSWQEFQQTAIQYIGSGASLQLTVKNSKTDRIRKVLLPINSWTIDPLKPDVLKSLGMMPYIPQLKPIMGEIVKNQAADKAGLQRGDEVVSINNEPINHWYQMLMLVQANGAKPLVFKILRDNIAKEYILHPKIKEYEGREIGFIGVAVKQQTIEEGWLRNRKYSLLTSFQMAFDETKTLIVTSFNMIGKFITGKLSVKNIGGPIGIAEGAGQAASIGLAYYLSFLALISISLGVINLLPVPMLDGGHLLFYMVEIIIGRQVSVAIREKFLMVGMVLLFALTGLAMFNDITRLLY